MVVIAPGEAPASTVKVPRRSKHQSGTGVSAWFAAPGTLWLLLLFVVPFYTVMAIAFGGIDPIFRSAQPEWNPLQWNFSSMNDVLGLRRRPGWRVRPHLLVRRDHPPALHAHRLPDRLLRGSPGRPQPGLLLVLIVIPFWISYLMRMLAWSSLLKNRQTSYTNDLTDPHGPGDRFEPSRACVGQSLRVWCWSWWRRG